MPIISRRQDYNGFAAKVSRLNLKSLCAEIEDALKFSLFIKKERHANGTKPIVQAIDSKFRDIGGWDQIKSGGIDWTKSDGHGHTVGVEVQISSRSDLVMRDIIHIKDAMVLGEIDIGVIIVPDDALSYFLTDRTPNFRTAVKHVEQWASDLPIRILAFKEDGEGEAIKKMRTNLGRK